MTMTAVIESHVPRVGTHSGSKITRVDILTTFAAAEEAWRQLSTPENVSTPYQTFDFLSLWQQHVGTQMGAEPYVVVAYDRDNRPVMVLPLVMCTRHGVKVAFFPGGKHANFKMALWQRDFAANATRKDIDDILKRIASHSDKPDVLSLPQQPLEWDGVQNPFALLPRQPAVNECPLLTLDPKAPPQTRFGSSFRRRLNGKEKKLKTLPGYRYVHATTVDEATRLLDMFFAVKPLRMAEQKIKNVFAEPGVEEFIRHACLDGLSEGKPAIALHGLVLESEVIAMFGGVGDNSRFSTMFNTYTNSEASKNSPGLVLLRNIIDNYADRGVPSFDFGVGTDEYKLQFCKERFPLFDSFLPLTAKGSAAAKMLSFESRVKRAIKQSPAAMKVAQMFRKGMS